MSFPNYASFWKMMVGRSEKCLLLLLFYLFFFQVTICVFLWESTKQYFQHGCCLLLVKMSHLEVRKRS